MAGSWGTLGAFSEVTLKVLPRPEKSRTVLLLDIDPAKATQAMALALNSPHDVSSACWLPMSLAALSGVDIVKSAKTSVTAIRIEGHAPSVEYRCKAIRKILKAHGKVAELHSHNSETFWAEVRDVRPFSHNDDQRVVWKISVAPSNGYKIIEQFKNLKAVDAFMDWGGGLVWLAVDAPNIGAEGLIREAVNHMGGHATLIRGPEKLRDSVPVFHPQPAALAKLNTNLRNSFDPYNLLNPGKMGY
jgi:glycolate oxidase FAD binding subunit